MKGKRIAAAVIVAVMGISQFSTALADKKSDAQDKKQEAEENLKEQQSEINQIQQEQKQLQDEINALDVELVQVIVELSTLEEELSIKEDELAQTQMNLEQAKIDEQTQYEAMKKRIKFMYERGDSSVISTVLESRSISDLINRVEYVNEVYDYDRQLLTQYQITKQQVADLEVQQKAEAEALAQKYQECQVAAENFQNTIARKQASMDNFDVKLAQARELASQYQDTISKQNTIIAQAEAEERAAAERARQEEEARKKAEEEARKKAEEEARRKAEEEAAASQNNNTGNSNNGSTGSGNNSDSGNAGGSGGTGSESSESKNPGYSTSIDPNEVVAFARKFVGNPYVWGGKDPNTGADCSGFTSYVYAHFGINIPSQSALQRSCGKEVSYENAQPGDLICYSGHVAIYMGNGKIVHAKGTAYGIVEGDKATYRPILTVRRLL